MPHLSTTIGCGYRYLSEIAYYFIGGNHEASSLGLCSSGPSARSWILCGARGHSASLAMLESSRSRSTYFKIQVIKIIKS